MLNKSKLVILTAVLCISSALSLFLSTNTFATSNYAQPCTKDMSWDWQTAITNAGGTPDLSSSSIILGFCEGISNGNIQFMGGDSTTDIMVIVSNNNVDKFTGVPPSIDNGYALQMGANRRFYRVETDNHLAYRSTAMEGYYPSGSYYQIDDTFGSITTSFLLNSSTWTNPPGSSIQMDMRSDFSLVGQYDNFTATYLKTNMCEFGINNNCNPSDTPQPLALRWRLINDDLTVSPNSYGDMIDANTVCTVVTAYNDPFTSASCINLFPENASRWTKNTHYTLYLQPFIQQAVLDELPQYDITMRYTGQAFNTSQANFSFDTTNNTISEQGTYTEPPTVSPYPDCGALYPIAWNSFDNLLPALGCQISNAFTVLFVPSTDSLNAIFTSTTFETHGLTSIITAPLTLINSLLTSNCSELSLPLPYVNSNLILPCMTTVYTTYFGSIFTIYQTITTGLICYWVIVKFLHKIKSFKDPDDDQIEVLNL